MKDFCLGFVLSGFIGLIVGYLWGCVDGYNVGHQNGAKSAENRLGRVETIETDKHPQSPDNG
jgi:ABC-type transporter Mla maintaining outer membrane lipid asymmetry permease subunit MlaE